MGLWCMIAIHAVIFQNYISTATDSFYHRFRVLENKQYSKGLVKDVQGNGVLDCIIKCKLNENCGIIFFHSDKRRCRLFGNHHDKATTDSPGWQAWRGNMCGKPPDIPNGDVVYDGYFLHAVANYTCKSDFRPCNSQTESRCEANGQWTPARHRCDRFRWTNPGIPFDKSLPCQPVGDLHIRITATPTGRRKMLFYLLLGKQILYHAACRFYFQNRYNWIAFNSRLLPGNVWGPEVQPKGFPFAVDKSFVMDITLKDGTYKMTVGTKTWLYRERQPGAAPTSIRIHGALRVQLVDVITR